MPFTTVYKPGPAWVGGSELTEHPGWDENLAYWRRMERDHGMGIVGVLATDPKTVVVVWRTGVLREVERLATAAPFVLSGVLSALTCEGAPEP